MIIKEGIRAVRSASIMRFLLLMRLLLSFLLNIQFPLLVFLQILQKFSGCKLKVRDLIVYLCGDSAVNLSIEGDEMGEAVSLIKHVHCYSMA